ncbi:hypothetical protein D9611_000703 [Ephemerocybe angulata]|uniref:Uncharacterized protein n=1 Tax=Ephemerocybe angulata TaxID=980116 RepID=A0A8H5F6X8_9AGAR|nr:hypothetical protein D9611_000703 [Tulosesus angulatus]
MESLNLNTLVNSLPAQQNAEKELLNDFKAAALSITTLYRSSRKNAKRAYNTGYATACQDLLNFIQHGVAAVDGGGMTIGRVMDWTEARLDAIKSVEEDEDEDEEREKERGRPGPSGAGVSTAAGAAASSKPEHARKPQPAGGNAAASTSRIPSAALPTPCSPQTNSSSQHPPEQPSSPSPGHTRTLHSQSTSYPQQHRQNKVRTPSKPDSLMIPFATQSSNGAASSGPTPTADPFNPTSPLSMNVPDTPMMIGAGAKRRHAMMMMMEAGGSGAVPSPTTDVLQRRRTRSTRNNQNVHVAGGQSSEDMEVEDEGRERKRVARR